MGAQARGGHDGRQRHAGRRAGLLAGAENAGGESWLGCVHACGGGDADHDDGCQAGEVDDGHEGGDGRQGQASLTPQPGPRRQKTVSACQNASPCQPAKYRA